ncbi:zinc-finger protein zpr1, putative [Theileria annulata]|uniref:Zinc-finger protein zpr1, putative n=1 Tax=Theileria annulata TaxID=5874 RepID=Q4UGS6_THEAN|nr:zinc-finger protein zpr1, putative [Theileria annulata]CAI73713.1 zinc-finger protein zpr1, putative [Theileria annulata]|eukprot:XP_954390.1 zinc-finger protein zpr1, putative [Theileria annulata]
MENESRIELENPGDYVNDDEAVVESVCMSCGENGTTRILARKIPHFNDILVMSFECSFCDNKNNEILNISKLQNLGVSYNIHVNNPEGLNNQIVITNTSAVKLIDLEFEIPKLDRKGIVTTIEGLLTNIINNLTDHISSFESLGVDNAETDAILNKELTNSTNDVSIKVDENVYKLAEYLQKLDKIKNRLVSYSTGLESFTLFIDDPSGNSYVENDNNKLELTVNKYERTNEHLEKMGYACQPEDEGSPDDDNESNGPHQSDHEDGLNDFFFVNCTNCGFKGKNQICEIAIPGFDKCIIMSFVCDNCNYRTNELKPGGGIKEYGKVWHLKINSVDDIKRDIILSNTCEISINELELTISPGSLSSLFTTIEGLINKIIENLHSTFPFLIGDSSLNSDEMSHNNGDSTPLVNGMYINKSKIKSLINKLKEVIDCRNGSKEGINIAFNDPLDNTFIFTYTNSNAQITSEGIKNNIDSIISKYNVVNEETKGSVEDCPDFDNLNIGKSALLDEKIVVDENLYYINYNRTDEQNEEFGLI